MSAKAIDSSGTSGTSNVGGVSSSSTASAATPSSAAAAAALLNQPIVMDIGTATIKAGFAGGAKPKVSIVKRWFPVYITAFLYYYLC
jgi:Actin and related proteins